MPVGTQGTVKGLPVELIAATGAQMILANTYHLALRPGAEVVAALGGLHQFCGWPGPILTDSGGFQVFSLAENVQVDEHGVTFRSHLDGNPFELTPEKAVAIQEQLGVDVAMVLDHVVALPGERGVVRDAAERTIRWAERSLAAPARQRSGPVRHRARRSRSPICASTAPSGWRRSIFPAMPSAA